MSNPQALLFDSSVVIAILNLNASEKHISEQVLKHIEQYPHAGRFVVSACLAEIFYLTKNLLPPNVVLTNLKHLNIELLPIAPSLEQEIFDSYSSSTHLSTFDFADFSISRIAALFDHVQILSMDRRDMPLAVSQVHKQYEDEELRLITFR